MTQRIRTRMAEAVPSLLLAPGPSAMPFGVQQVALAPAATGVYFLYRGSRVIYIGVAVHGSDIRQEVERHRQGFYGPATMVATSFDYELSGNAVVTCSEYLCAYRARNAGRLPSCNQEISRGLS